jgi:dTDP-4-dehydrorhamnose reductase
MGGRRIATLTVRARRRLLPGWSRGPPARRWCSAGAGSWGRTWRWRPGEDAVVAARTPGPRATARFERLDATDPGRIERFLDGLRPARILQCAALSSAADAEARPELARALNVDLPASVALWCARTGARLVHVSTDLVFGGREPPATGFREEDPPAPLSVYGRSKAAGEAAVLEACPSALVVRLPLLCGDSFGRGRGASDSLLAAIARGERPTLFSDEWRTPLDVADAARALVELAGADASGLLHVAGPDRLSRHELGLVVLQSRGMSAEAAAAAIRSGTRSEAGMERVRARDASLDARRAASFLATPLAVDPEVSAGTGVTRARAARPYWAWSWRRLPGRNA